MGRDHCIISNVDGVGAAGAHRTATEGAATCCIGLKVRWCVCEANRTAIGGSTAVIQQHTAAGVERAAKGNAHTCEGGGAGICATDIDRAVIGLWEGTGVHAAAIDGGGTMNRQVTERSHRSTKCHGGCGDYAGTTEPHRAHKTQRTSASQIAVDDCETGTEQA